MGTIITQALRAGAFGAISLAFLTAAHAQQTEIAANEAATSETAEPARETPKRRSLDEVIVTAQKRAQNLQEVPLSVSAISGEMIEQSNMEDMNDVARYTPNLKVQAGGVLNTVYIRGLGSDQNEGIESSVGLFIDDVYYGKVHYITAALLDVERVEILRGPQGSLFGKNTIAGAIALHTGTPGNDWEAKISGSMAERDKRQIDAVINVPIVDDKLAFRLAGYWSDETGAVFNTFHQQDDGAIERSAVRAKLKWDITDDLNVSGTFLFNRGALPQGIGAQLSAAPEPFLTFFRLFDPETEANLEDRRNTTDTINDGLQLSTDYTGKVSWDVWDHNLSLILANSHYERKAIIDADFGPTQALTLLADQHYTQYSGELKVTSGLGSLEYVGGLFFFYSEQRNKQDINVIPIEDAFAEAFRLVLPDILASLGLEDSLPDVPLRTETVRSDYYQENTTMAAYGQLTWNITESLSLIGGARYSIDEKDLDFQNRLFTLDQEGAAPILMTVLSAREFDVTRSSEFKNFSPKVSALWRAFDWGNLYATYAEGFKSGGYNAAAVNDEEISFDEESSVTYELGIKTEFWDNRARLNIGLFRTEFDDLQISVFNGIDTIVRNAAQARSQGLEVDGTVLFDFGLTAIASLALLDGEYTHYPEGPCPSSLDNSAGAGEDGNCDLSGSPLAKTPDYQASLSLTYARNLGFVPMDFMIGGDVLIQGDAHMASDLDPLDFQEAYQMYNARIGVQDEDGNWSFTLAIRNITDEYVKLFSADVPFYSGSHYAVLDQPRTVSINFRAEF